MWKYFMQGLMFFSRGSRKRKHDFLIKLNNFLIANDLTSPTSRETLTKRELRKLDIFWSEHREFYLMSGMYVVSGLPMYGPDGERVFIPAFVKVEK